MLGNLWKVIEGWLPSREFEVIYKATRDGFSSEDFHWACDNKGPSLTIIQSTDGYIFGGYSPNSWTSASEYYSHTDSFLFTLLNPHSFPPTQYFLLPDNPFAIRGHSAYCAVFGSGDISVHSHSNANNYSSVYFPSSYMDSTGKGKFTFTIGINFTTQEIEVYTVANKFV